MKRFRRPEAEAARVAISKGFYGFGGGPHYIYAVVASRAGLRWPIYVGETSRPRKRFEQHLTVSYAGREGRGRTGQLEGSVVAAGGTLEFHCLGEAANRIESLALEASWARALSAVGVALGNTWREHRSSSKLILVPIERLAFLSLKEAISVKLEFGLSCVACATELKLPSDLVVRACDRNPRLGVFARSLNCPDCGAAFQLAVFPGAVHDEMRRIDQGRGDIESFLLSIRAKLR